MAQHTEVVHEVIFNGRRMPADWPGRVWEAQAETFSEIAGRMYPRVRYGDEGAAEPEWPCEGCAVLAGQFHVPECPVEICRLCTGQPAFSCRLCDYIPDDR